MLQKWEVLVLCPHSWPLYWGGECDIDTPYIGGVTNCLHQGVPIRVQDSMSFCGLLFQFCTNMPDLTVYVAGHSESAVYGLLCQGLSNLNCNIETLFVLVCHGSGQSLVEAGSVSSRELVCCVVENVFVSNVFLSTKNVAWLHVMFYLEFIYSSCITVCS